MAVIACTWHRFGVVMIIRAGNSAICGTLHDLVASFQRKNFRGIQTFHLYEHEHDIVGMADFLLWLAATENIQHFCHDSQNH